MAFKRHCLHEWTIVHVQNLMMFEVEYALISCVCLYRILDSKCHELESTTPKFDGVCFFYISPKFVAIQECLEFRLHQSI
jgi:hypothetical protein